MVSPSYSPMVARECVHMICTAGLHDGNPNDFYSNACIDWTKHTLSPSYSPTVARECLHIKCTVGLYDGNLNDLYTKMNYNECTLIAEHVREGGYI